jgi:Tfp pilus assembly protein PilF
LQYRGGERIPAELNLAVCYYNVGQTGLAIDHLKSALEETVGPPGAMKLLIQLLDQAGREAEAQRYRERLRRLSST